MKILPLLLTVLSFTSLCGQVDLQYYLPEDNISYNSQISTPKEVFGFEIGEWHLTPAQNLSYLKLLESQSDRLKIFQLGKTYEQRPTILMIITSAENQRNLVKIQTERSRLFDPETSDKVDIDNLPGVIWLGYSIHGNEASGQNTVPLIAYYLTAGNSPQVEDLLDHTIILIEPFINPDGLNRFATWVNMHRGKHLVSDSYHREHQEAWPFGRTNHYWFDLNRDWMTAQHPETRGRLPLLYKWLPNIVTDHHEMDTDATFFFQPGIKSRNNPMVPDQTYELTAKIAEYHAKALDRTGALYFSEELFDDFYIGKGSTLTDIIGTIGILFEQASVRGHLQVSDNGPISFPFAIKNQVTASLSSLKAIQEMRRELNTYQKKFFEEVYTLAENDAAAYLLGSIDTQRNQALKELLFRHQIDVFELAEDVKMNGYQYRGGRDFLVPLRQKQYRLIVSLFEERTTFRDSLFYDISSWNLAHSFNLRFSRLESQKQLRKLKGSLFEGEGLPPGRIETEDNIYAYLMSWDSYNSSRALNRLQEAGIFCKVARQPFDISFKGSEKHFREGTILIPLSIQNSSLSEIQSLMKIIAQQDGINITAVSGGYSGQGIRLGSTEFAALEKISPVLIVGDGISYSEAGEVWHLLDQRLDMACPLVDLELFNKLDFAPYNVMIMVNGDYSTIDSAGVAHLRTWLQFGGTLISTRTASKWLAESGLADIEVKEIEKVNKDTVTVRRKYSSARYFKGAQAIGGAIFLADLDLSHPLGYGFESNQIPVFKRSQLIIRPVRNPYNTPLIFKENGLLCGYISNENYARLAGSAAVSIHAVEKGRIIVFTEDPNFRAVWYGTNRLFMNALMFGQIIRNYDY